MPMGGSGNLQVAGDVRVLIYLQQVKLQLLLVKFQCIKGKIQVGPSTLKLTMQDMRVIL